MKIVFYSLLALIAMCIFLALTGCGGTFTLDSNGNFSYTTPRLIEAQPATSK